jgi:hypothetical protein
MASKVEYIIVLCVEFMFMVCLVSCGTTTLQVLPVKQFDIVQVENKIQLKACLYLSQEYRTGKLMMIGENKRIIPVANAGDALCDCAEKVARSLFQDVIVLDSLKNSGKAALNSYDVIVTPQLIEFAEKAGERHFLLVDFYTQNTITWTIASPEGKEIYKNTIQSDDIKGKEGVEISLKDQCQKAQKDIYSNGWWKKQWWKESK